MNVTTVVFKKNKIIMLVDPNCIPESETQDFLD
jgi:hypothetical protein